MQNNFNLYPTDIWHHGQYKLTALYHPEKGLSATLTPNNAESTTLCRAVNLIYPKALNQLIHNQPLINLADHFYLRLNPCEGEPSFNAYLCVRGKGGGMGFSCNRAAKVAAQEIAPLKREIRHLIALILDNAPSQSYQKTFEVLRELKKQLATEDPVRAACDLLNALSAPHFQLVAPGIRYILIKQIRPLIHAAFIKNPHNCKIEESTKRALLALIKKVTCSIHPHQVHAHGQIFELECATAALHVLSDASPSHIRILSGILKDLSKSEETPQNTLQEESFQYILANFSHWYELVLLSESCRKLGCIAESGIHRLLTILHHEVPGSLHAKYSAIESLGHITRYAQTSALQEHAWFENSEFENSEFENSGFENCDTSSTHAREAHFRFLLIQKNPSKIREKILELCLLLHDHPNAAIASNVTLLFSEQRFLETDPITKLLLHNPQLVIPFKLASTLFNAPDSTILWTTADVIRQQNDITTVVGQFSGTLEAILYNAFHPSLAQQLATIKYKFLNNPALQRDIDSAIILQATSSPYGTDMRDALSITEEFLEPHNPTKTLLITGPSGSGKTFLAKHLTFNMWNNWQQNNVQLCPIPLFISLEHLEHPKTQLIEETLFHYGFSENDINHLREQYTFVFICDGYDHLAESVNLRLTNHLEKWNYKMIITCRSENLTAQKYPEKLYPSDLKNREFANAESGRFELPEIGRCGNTGPVSDGSKMAFSAKAKTNSSVSMGIQQIMLQPTSLAANLSWLGRKNHALISLQKQCSEFINANSDWLNSTQTPSTLQGLACILPSLLQRDARSPLSLSQFYKLWIDHLLNKALEQLSLPPPELEKLKNDYLSICRELALYTFCSKRSITQIASRLLVEKFPTQRSRSLHEVTPSFYDLRAPSLKSLHGMQILSISQNNKYDFCEHKFLEYFFYCSLLDSYNQSTENPSPFTQENWRGRLNQTTLSKHPYILQLFAETLISTPTLEAALFSIIEASRTRPELAIAAGNALSILNKGALYLSALDLHDTHIRGADLTEAILDGINFKNAKLYDIYLKNAFTRNMNLSGCTLKNVGFDNRPSLYGHIGAIHHICFANSSTMSSTMLASAGADNTICIWNILSGELLNKLKGHNAAVNKVIFTKDNKLLLSCSRDGSIRAWELKTGKCIQAIRYAPSSFCDIGFAKNHSLIISASNENDLCMWDFHTGQCHQVIKGHHKGVHCIAISEQEDFFVSGSSDHTLRVWDIQGKCRLILEGHYAAVKCVAISQHDNSIASGSDDATIRIWEPHTGRCSHTITDHDGPIIGLQFSENGKILISTSADRSVRVWETATGRCLKALRDHPTVLSSATMTLDNSLCIATAGSDAAIHIRDVTLNTESMLAPKFHGPARHLQIIPAKSLYAAVGADNVIYLKQIPTGLYIKAFKDHQHPITCLQVSQDSNLLAASTQDNSIYLWNIASGECIQTLRSNSSGNIVQMAISANNQYIFSVNDNSLWQVWDTVTGQNILHTCTEHSGIEKKEKFSLLCHTTNNLIACGNSSPIIELRDTSSGQLMYNLNAMTATLSLCSHPKKCILVSGGSDGVISFWDMETHLLLKRLQNNKKSGISSLAFSDDGNLLFVGCQDGILEIWDAAAEESSCLYRDRGHNEPITHLHALSNPGKLLSASCSQTLCLWEVLSQDNVPELILTWSSEPFSCRNKAPDSPS